MHRYFIYGILPWALSKYFSPVWTGPFQARTMYISSKVLHVQVTRPLTVLVAVFVFLLSLMFWLEMDHGKSIDYYAMKTWNGKPPNLFSNKSIPVVFIKTHKTGSTTVQSLLYRYGFYRKLSFVFRRQNPKNGHVRYIAVTKDSPKSMFLPVLGNGKCSYKGYDISAIHIVHNRPVMESYMTTGAKFITILRNPLSQFISAFLFFHLDKNMAGNSMEDKILHFTRTENWKKTDYGRNSQSYDLGLGRNNFDNENEIKKLIQKLSKELDLVMISDYFQESLVLLKQELRWSYEDISFFSQNKGKREKPEYSAQLLNAIKKFNHADVLLYDYFNKTLWDKINRQGPKFWEELEEYKRIQNQTVFQCLNTTSKFRLEDNEFSGDMCESFVAGKMFKLLFDRQNRKC